MDWLNSMPNIPTFVGDDIKALAEELDKLLAEYSARHSVVFETEESRLASSFGSRRRRKREWEQSRPCMFPNCKKLSVTRSHTIPRAALALIAEGGHVLTPKFNEVKMRLEMQRIGINQASTFPGFCSGHEQVFQCFEKKIGLQEDSPFHIILQVFRTLCQEIAITAHTLECLKEAAELHRTQLDSWGRQKLEGFIRSRGLEPVRGFAITGVGPLARAEEAIADSTEHLERLRRHALGTFLTGFRSGVLKGTLIHHFVPGRLPIALAGHSYFRYMAKGATSLEDVLLFVGIHPCPSGSFLMIWTPFENSDAIVDYLRLFGAHPGERSAIIRIMEAWMLSGSDHWYITPSVWSGLTSSERDSVLEAISDIDHSIVNPLPPGVFSRILLEWSEG